MFWLYIYELIRIDLGFSYEGDVRASYIANMLSNPYEVEEVVKFLSRLLLGSKVLVVGASNSCIKVKELVGSYDVVIAADGALRCCLDVGVKPDIVVTDLDGARHQPKKVFDRQGKRGQIVRLEFWQVDDYIRFCQGFKQVQPM